MRNPICLIRTLWRSLTCGAWVMGHDYEQIGEPTPPNVLVVRCRTCGTVEVAWDSCADCKRPIHMNDDARVCIQCGGMNVRREQ